MTGPNMATITASLERSLQNCSLNNNHHQSSTTSNGGIVRSESSENHVFSNNNHSDATLDLNSDISLPYHWEQCLDLKTGEIYYINWRTGMKVKEDPRTSGEEVYGGDLYSEEEEDDSSYDSDEGSSSEELTSFPSSRQQQISHAGKSSSSTATAAAAVLVVGGCKSCLMYFMVPKEVEDCPKCCGQLLHFDRSENGSP